jgi:hypothetical protein
VSIEHKILPETHIYKHVCDDTLGTGLGTRHRAILSYGKLFWDDGRGPAWYCCPQCGEELPQDALEAQRMLEATPSVEGIQPALPLGWE